MNKNAIQIKQRHKTTERWTSTNGHTTTSEHKPSCFTEQREKERKLSYARNCSSQKKVKLKKEKQQQHYLTQEHLHKLWNEMISK
ncbi:CLUMA_CG008999, isoform A [Clunio marinus]|uniref:CLUMA_CG008999, isoform A n=1 Tax=Clunio marinus TaxID=568069 RepID=A0A1J1I709_9DIPT|nr:CLUMA_CG008999, isoform A [Clunio marinus]